MKKLFSILMLTAMVFCVSSCGSDDDDVKPAKAAYASVAANYSLEFSDQMLAMSVITAKYTNEKGDTATETINAKTWTKQVKINKPVSDVYLQVYLTKKDGADYSENSPYIKTSEKGTYYFDFWITDGAVSATTYDARGNEIAMRSSKVNTNARHCNLDKLELLLDKESAQPFREKDLHISENGDDIY